MGAAAVAAIVSSPLLAAGDGDTSSAGLAKLGAAIAIGIGAAGAAAGQGNAASSALEGIARNPTSRSDVFVPMILSLVFMEFQALLSLLSLFSSQTNHTKKRLL